MYTHSLSPLHSLTHSLHTHSLPPLHSLTHSLTHLITYAGGSHAGGARRPSRRSLPEGVLGFGLGFSGFSDSSWPNPAVGSRLGFRHSSWPQPAVGFRDSSWPKPAVGSRLGFRL